MTEDQDGLRALGRPDVQHHFDAPAPALLERFANPASAGATNPSGAALALRIDVPEFTCLCPITGQPDWARIVIRYQPDRWCVESKSLKLYLGSFRNAGEFHEAAVTRICNDLVRVLEPQWLVVEGRFTPRGGIPFWPVALYRRDQQGTGGADVDRLQQPDLFEVLEPMTERMDRAGAREDVI